MSEQLKEAIHLISNVREMIQWGGTLLICGIVFVETGLFVGFCLPGDSLLVTAGVLARAEHFHSLELIWLLLSITFCAIAGDQLGYWIGRKGGQSLYKKGDSLLFKKRHLQRASEFYSRYGGKTVILARFVPIIRTFMAPVAGAARMNYRRFLLFDILGGFLWVWSMVLIGYGLAAIVPDVEKKIHIVIAAVILLSILPAIIEAIRQRNQKITPAQESEPEVKNI
jgi:membrane-associated protein